METPKNIEKIRDLISEVAHKNDRILLDSCKEWTLKEKSYQALVILHIAEIGRRKLHIDQGFSSLFEYCQKRLNFSESETYLRTQVAGACTRYPELLVELSCGNLSLTVAGRIAAKINDENKAALLEACRGKNKRQVEDYLADISPLAAPVSSLRQKPLATDEVGTLEFDFEQADSSCAWAPVASGAEKKPRAATLAPLGQQRHHLHCTISEETKQDLLRLAEVLGIDSPFTQLDELIRKAAEIAVKAKDPAQKAQKTTKNPKPTSHKEKKKKKSVKRAYIPKATKNAVFARAGYCCEYIGLEGQRCGQRTHLQIEHKHPLFLGGSNEISNLQIFCSSHNRRKNELECGRPWVA